MRRALERQALLRVKLSVVAVILLLVGHALGFAPPENDESSSSSASSNQINIVTKNAVIDISTKYNEIILDITKNEGSRTRNILYTSNDDAGTMSINHTCDPHRICISRGTEIDTIIEASPNEEMLKISRMTSSENSIVDCYELADNVQWYGGPQMRYQHWPIQHMYFEEEPYLPTHPTNMALTERYWLNSQGFWIWVNETSPLFLDQNNIRDKRICLVARNKPPYQTRTKVRLDYFIGQSATPKKAHELVTSVFLQRPSGHPDVRMIEHPIWSTWARYKINVSETVVNEFADEIISHGFNNSQLEIDDNWETCYGSAIFDPVKFPNVSRVTANLKKKGFRVTLWIHPFINEGCEPAYSNALKNNYFVENLNGDVRMTWWQGAKAATIDFTNTRALNWWINRLRLLLASGIDGFKFDAGEVSWLPQVASLNASLELQPGSFTTDYVTALARNFGNISEVRVGWKTQNLPIFVRMIDKDTKWTWNNGLPTLITTLLQMNLNGYVHVLPDMIGGNGYLDGFLNGTYLPSRELFVRWLQANVFMPALQYSFVPWDFDNEIVNISRKYTDLHARITPIIVRLMKKSVATGAPLNPPVWWIAPNDPVAHKINDAYLLGDEILVAPVTREGVISRDVYLPAGTWKDPNKNKTHLGAVWLRDYPAPLNILPYFIREINGTYSL